jgi:hypothetical protein
MRDVFAIAAGTTLNFTSDDGGFLAQVETPCGNDRFRLNTDIQARQIDVCL